MQINNPLPSILSFAKTNSPILTTMAAVSGVVVTAVLAAKAGYKTGYTDGNDAKHERVQSSSLVKFKSDWKLYVPAASALSITVGTIIAGHRVNASRTAAMTAAYSLSERAFGEYRARVVEKLGVNEEQAIQEELKAAEKSREEFQTTKGVMIIGDGAVTCMDAHSGRYFANTMQGIRRAQNDINEKIYDQMYASLSDYYDLVGLDPIKNSDDVGWNTDKPFRIKFGAGLTPEDKPCLVVNFLNDPFQAHDMFN